MNKVILLFFSFFISLMVYCQSDHVNNCLKVGFCKGALVPNFKFYDYQGNQGQLFQYRAKRTLMVFYSPGCASCENELGMLASLHELYSRKGLKILVMVVDSLVDYSTIDEIQKKGSFDVRAIQGKEALEVLNCYNVSMVPAFYILDKRKKIIAVTYQSEQLLNLLDKAMH